MSSADLFECLKILQNKYDTELLILKKLQDDIDTISDTIDVIGSSNSPAKLSDEVDESDHEIVSSGSAASGGSAAGSPAATGKKPSFTQVVRKDIGDNGFVPPKTKPKQPPRALHPKIARTFNWCKYLDKKDNKIKADMSNISGNLNMQFQKQKRDCKGNLALVTTSYVNPDETGMYVVTFTGDNSGKLDPDVNGTLGWKKNIPFDIDEKYCKAVVDSVDDILSVQCKEYLLLEVTKTANKDCPFKFLFMRFYYNN